MLSVRLAIGIPSLMDRKNNFDRSIVSEELAVFILQMIVHFAGIIGTWVLSAKQKPTI